MADEAFDRWCALEATTRHGVSVQLVEATASGVATLLPDVMDPQQMQFMHVPAFARAPAATDFLHGMLVDPGPSLNWLLQIEGRVAGWICLFDFQHDMCELGYFVRAAETGQGLATAAAHCVTQYAHGAVDRRRINASADPRNTASHRVLASCGFLHEGTQRGNFLYGSVWQDTALFGRLRTDPLPAISLDLST